MTDKTTHVEIDEATTHRPYPYLYAQGKQWAPKAELDDLLAQANRTATIYEKEIGMLRAENERITGLLSDLGRAYETRAGLCEKAEAENERLRAAAQRVIELPALDPQFAPITRTTRWRQLAAALAPHKE